MYLAEVQITLKKSVFDPQGAAVQQSLEALGFDAVQQVRIGKYVELKLDEKDIATAEARTQEMCEQLLANPVVEKYQFNIKEVSE
jgi:phosphoribosylformylglycinamidine synthase PurS subunit